MGARWEGKSIGVVRSNVPQFGVVLSEGQYRWHCVAAVKRCNMSLRRKDRHVAPVVLFHHSCPLALPGETSTELRG